jgi:hypothetical protein
MSRLTVSLPKCMGSSKHDGSGGGHPGDGCIGGALPVVATSATGVNSR